MFKGYLSIRIPVIKNFIILNLLVQFSYAVSNDELLKRLELLERKLSNQQQLQLEIQQLRAEIQKLKGFQSVVVDDIEEVKDELSDSDSNLQDYVQSANGDLTIGGYVDVEFHHRNVRGESAPSKFDQHRLVFDVQARLSSKASFTAELEYEHAAGSVGLEQGYIDYSLHRSFNLRAGSILVPMGRVNYLHDSPLQELNERPLVSRILIPSTWYDVGAGFFGQTGHGDGAVSYEMYLMNGLQDDGNNLAGGSGFRNLRKKGRSGTEDNNNKAFTARLGFTPARDLQLGLGYYRADVGSYTNDRDPVLGGERYLNLWAFDLEKTINSRLDIQGEYAWGDVDHNQVSAIAPTNFQPNNSAYDYSGWYTQLNYALGDHSKYKAIFRWGRTDTAKDFQNGGDRTEKVLGLNFRPDDSTVYKIEYHWEDEMSNAVLGNKLNNDGFVLGVATYF